MIILKDKGIIDQMRIQFTKMQGLGNDFVVLNETNERLNLNPTQYRWLADRHFGVGADQVLSVRAATSVDVDFEYVIHNSDGSQVEQCGNGARCFARFVLDQGLTTKKQIRVQTLKGIITPCVHEDGQVTVDMGVPSFQLDDIGFDFEGLMPVNFGESACWLLPMRDGSDAPIVPLSLVSMGNPHAVQIVTDVAKAQVLEWGSYLQTCRRFKNRVNVGYMQVLDRTHIDLRVYERGAGETLSCGTGACAAVVAGILQGVLDYHVVVKTKGGKLSVSWEGPTSAVMMTGPATTVFQGYIDVPKEL
tara:strand:+ start:896 stop:1807 length:912 start_codon:yes stop_codon:yes gene_type:complete